VGYSGETCVVFDPCATMDCGGHGTCEGGACRCAESYTGNRCETQTGPDPGVFVVNSGPYTTSEAGRCVGRPNGYGPNEECNIVVSGGGGLVDECSVFDTGGPGHPPYATSRGASGVHCCDYVTVGGTQYSGSGCPTGEVLDRDDTITWISNSDHQGEDEGPSRPGYGNDWNGCKAKNTCGVQESTHGVGGGWQICLVR
jgi:hypothetical protein